MTLVEVLVFIVIFSILLTSLVGYAYHIQKRDFDLMNEINDAYEE